MRISDWSSDVCSSDLGKPPAMVPRQFRIEIDERLDHAGTVLRELDEAQVREAARAFGAARIEAVPICFLHSYRNAAHERRAAAIRSEERRVGKECVSTCISRCSPDH